MAKQYYKLDEIVFAEKPKDPRFKDLEGLIFGRLKVIGFKGLRARGHKDWFCQCDCGNIISAIGGNLLSDAIKSCGCLKKEVTGNRARIHGKGHSPEFTIFHHMKGRCNNPKDAAYKNYGGRGIEVILTFEEFLEEVGERPGKDYSIDRINNEKSYEKGNIRWATRETQANNRRSNTYVSVDGVSKTLTQWAKQEAIDSECIRLRIKRGWCNNHAVFSPLGLKKPKNCLECNKSRNPIPNITEA